MASPPRALTLVLAVLAVLLPTAGISIYYSQVSSGSAADVHIVLAQLRGTNGPGSPEGLRVDVGWHLVLVAGVSLGLFAGVLAGRLARPEGDRGVAFGRLAAAGFAAAGVVANVLLLVASHTSGNAWYVAASIAATIMWCSLVPAVAVAAAVLITAVRAAFPGPAGTLEDEKFVRPAPLDADETGVGREAGTAETARWQRAYGVPVCHPDPTADAGEARNRPVVTPDGTDVIGIGLSGGGIRAASTALGVLQSTAFRERVVAGASYLVSVSGGGYTSGAFAQFLTGAGAPKTDESAADRGRTAFLVGTPEEDYLRRHSSYLADTPGLMVVALSVIAWHLLLTLTVVFGGAALAGILIGRLYRAVPLAGYDPSTWTSLESGTAPSFPTLRAAAFGALGLLVVLATLAWLGSQLAAAHQARTERTHLAMLARHVSILAGFVAALTIALPTVIWASAFFLHHTRGGGLHVITPVAGVLFTYLASVGSLLWKNKSALAKAASGKAPSSVPSGFLQIVLVIGGNLVLGLSWLMLAGAMATIGLHPMDTTTVVAVGVLAVVVVFLGGLTDETTLSLHPFYRARLANTFAVRRGVSADGYPVAQPYEAAERTWLSRYGQHADGTSFPHIVFAASATLGGHRAPPGQNRVSYTFCSHWVGGPDVGWVDTATLEDLAPPRLQRDLTVQSAVALSGAAIAASTGGQGTGWYESLFVLTGARLGAWMPNPTFVIDRHRKGSTAAGGLPHTRRLDYLLRELIGVHGARAPLLQVTDGGFYDNLGLLELFRRGCTEIYCVDASGDTPPTASTLAQTLLMARRELGVEVTEPDPIWTTYTAGSGAPLEPLQPLESLSSRLARTGLIDIAFTYPDCGPAPGRSGRLVVAKAALWAELGYPLLTYAHRSQTFPYDSTADQFFDADRYIAYTELGRRLGDAVVTAMDAPRNTTANGAGRPRPTTQPAPAKEST